MRPASVLALLALLAGASCRFAGGKPGEEASAPPPTAVATRGTFTVTIDEVGVIAAGSATSIKPPFWGRVVELIPEGSPVEAGTPVLWLDTVDLERRRERQDADVLSARSNLDSRLQEIELKRKQTALETRTSAARLAFGEARLASQRDRTADARRQESAGLLPAAGLRREEQALLEAEHEDESARLRHEMQLQDASREEQRLEADRRSAERQFATSSERRDETVAEIAAAIVTSPAKGVVTYALGWYPGAEGPRKVRVGDQVGPWNSAVLEVPDTSTLEVRTQVEETLVERVPVGTPVEIRPTALEGVVLAGRVLRQAPLALPRSKAEGAGFTETSGGRREQIVVTAIVSFDTKEARLQPGMSVAVAFVLQTLEGVVTVPAAAILGAGSETRVVVAGRREPEERRVKVGVAGGGRVVVLEGLEAGEEVFLGDPREIRRPRREPGSEPGS